MSGDQQPGDRQEQDAVLAAPREPGQLAWRVAGLLALGAALAACAHFFSMHSALLNTYLHLFNWSENPYYFEGGFDWIGIGGGAGAALALILVGYALLSMLDLFIPRLARLALAYVVGMGAVGVALEVETILGLHRRESILATLGVVFVAALIVRNYRTSRPVTTSHFSQWGDLRAEVAHQYAQRYRHSLVLPLGPLAVSAQTILFLLVAAITLLTFYHGVFCPETYWDSLILYVNYARELFYEHRFPFNDKAVAQVGIGLGANYPHLYALITAATATVAGRWSDAFAQFGPPLAGLMSCLLVYHMALRLTRHRLLALALTAVFRAVPYGIAYYIYASDYAFVMLFVAAFFYVALLYIETGLWGYFILATLIAAFAMHLNYLMGLLWVVWAAMVLLTHVRPYREPGEMLELLDEEDMALRDLVDMQTANLQPPTLRRLLLTQRFWAWLLVGIAVASPWYIRNYVLTGNPVYAFFPSLFPRTVHYNQEVMDSAAVEWTLNGDGIAAASLTRDFWQQFDRFRRAADVSRMEIARIDTPPARKLAASWRFWVADFNAWKLAPSFLGIALPGLLVFLLGIRPRREADLSDREGMARRRLGWLCVLLLILLLAYHYLLAGFYLYQIIPLVVLIPLFGVYFVSALRGKFERGLFVALAIWMALLPGLPDALMGFKIRRNVRLGGRLYTQFNLVALHHVGLDSENFYRLAFDWDVDAWAALNVACLETEVLTHENRHLVLDRRVKIVHFDDWDVQALWEKSPAEQLAGLRKLGVTHYLFVPNEIKHQVNRRLGPPASRDVDDKSPEPWQLSALRGWIESGVLEMFDSYGENRLYLFRYPDPAAATRP